jgi:hypothetical protein
MLCNCGSGLTGKRYPLFENCVYKPKGINKKEYFCEKCYPEKSRLLKSVIMKAIAGLVDELGYEGKMTHGNIVEDVGVVAKTNKTSLDKENV